MANIFSTSNPFYSTNDNMSIEQKMALLQNKLTPQEQPAQPQNEQQPKGRFGQLSDFVKNSQPTKMQWTFQQREVQERMQAMMNVFVGEFLFENAKEQFEGWCNANSRTCVNDYIDTFIETSKTYVDPTSEQDKKIQMQEQEIAQLKAMVSEIASQKAGDKL